MGMYTELNVSMNLKLDRNTMEVLKVMLGEREKWEQILNCLTTLCSRQAHRGGTICSGVSHFTLTTQQVLI